jgi:hypothetical protein
MLERSPFISTWIQVAPTLLSKLTRPTSRPIKEWELRVLRDLYKVSQNMTFSSEDNIRHAAEILSEMAKSFSQYAVDIRESSYKDKLKETVYHFMFSLLYPNITKASELFVFLSNELKTDMI